MAEERHTVALLDALLERGRLGLSETPGGNRREADRSGHRRRMHAAVSFSLSAQRARLRAWQFRSFSRRPARLKAPRAEGTHGRY